MTEIAGQHSQGVMQRRGGDQDVEARDRLARSTQVRPRCSKSIHDEAAETERPVALTISLGSEINAKAV